VNAVLRYVNDALAAACRPPAKGAMGRTVPPSVAPAVARPHDAIATFLLEHDAHRLEACPTGGGAGERREYFVLCRRCRASVTGIAAALRGVRALARSLRAMETVGFATCHEYTMRLFLRNHARHELEIPTARVLLCRRCCSSAVFDAARLRALAPDLGVTAPTG
jgi:hypothetical protein